MNINTVKIPAWNLWIKSPEEGPVASLIAPEVLAHRPAELLRSDLSWPEPHFHVRLFLQSIMFIYCFP